LPCGSNYPTNVDTVLVYGPFSLQDAAAARLTFWTWSLTESGYDTCFFGASTDGDAFGGVWTSGQLDHWEDRELDLSAVPYLGSLLGSPQVWIGFHFHSDCSATLSEGWFIDAVRVVKLVNGRTLYTPPTERQTTTAGEPTLMYLRRP
jgi:hypothetical protein